MVEFNALCRLNVLFEAVYNNNAPSKNNQKLSIYVGMRRSFYKIRNQQTHAVVTQHFCLGLHATPLSFMSGAERANIQGQRK
jgi:hypothetical protein